MTRTTVPLESLSVNPCRLWAEQWLALAAGDFPGGRFNAMTVAWGSLGTMWGKPFAQVVVRPCRYTFEFMEQYDTFTLSAFAERYRPALQFLGTHSGRNTGKIKESGLTPVASSKVAAPSFQEAELSIECRKMYWDDIEPGHFLDPEIGGNYPEKDYHRVYFGKILALTRA
jgi:flavin reductase (DIM6/NTAB) family NADH-FMN oxidoreductase RutF